MYLYLRTGIFAYLREHSNTISHGITKAKASALGRNHYFIDRIKRLV